MLLTVWNSLLISDPTPAGDWLGYLLNFGVAGLVLALFLTGQIEPKRVRAGLEESVKDWKAAFDTERAAHQLTRDALATANGRAEAATEAANTMTRILQESGHRPSGRIPT